MNRGPERHEKRKAFRRSNFFVEESFLNKAPSSLDLFNRLLVGSVDENERLFVCELINEEFCEAGIDEAGEPTGLGMALERLLDFINRPNISH